MQEPGLVQPRSQGVSARLLDRAGSETDFEEGLSGSWGIPLANRTAINDAEVRIIDVVCAVGVRIADLKAVKDVGEFHS
jgi:hypothetical protein